LVVVVALLIELLLIGRNRAKSFIKYSEEQMLELGKRYYRPQEDEEDEMAKFLRLAEEEVFISVAVKRQGLLAKLKNKNQSHNNDNELIIVIIIIIIIVCYNDKLRFDYKVLITKAS